MKNAMRVVSAGAIFLVISLDRRNANANEIVHACMKSRYESLLDKERKHISRAFSRKSKLRRNFKR